MLVLFSIRLAESPVFGKDLFIQFTVRAFCERLSICVCDSFPFGFEGWMSDLIILISDHCLSIYFRHLSPETDCIVVLFYLKRLSSRCRAPMKASRTLFEALVLKLSLQNISKLES